MVILLPDPVYKTEYIAEPFETVLMGVAFVIVGLKTEIAISLGFSVACVGNVAADGGADDTTAATADEEEATVVTQIGFADEVWTNDVVVLAVGAIADVALLNVVFLALIKPLPLGFWLVVTDDDALVKMHGNIEILDFGKPELLLYSSWNCAPSSINSAKFCGASVVPLAMASTCTYLCMLEYTVGVASMYLHRLL